MNAPAFPITNLPNRTPQDYAADLVRRFGKMPSMEQLASMESAAMRAANGRNVHLASPATKADVAENPTCQAILRLLAKPMTCRQLCEVSGMNKATAKSAFQRLTNAGLIRKHGMTGQHVTIWERAE